LSPRAACRLGTLGFEYVYDYMPGKVDWLARGLPREGEKAAERRAVDVARDDAVTCGLDERIADVRGRVEASPYGFAFVVSEGGTLLGRLRKAALEGDADATANDAMEPGPSTVRANTTLDRLRDRLDQGNLKTAVVTTPEGSLLGVVRRSDLDP
jgi:CBS domain-containing protein